MGIHKIVDYEKIAAGEVIERPASVVKELLENAIDAGADRIEIHLEQAGMKSIKIIDNGKGIDPGEVVLAFERHTTSKITGFDDIYKLVTLGFRGEALASIKVIARVEISTKIRGNDVGRRVVFEGDVIVEESDVACPDGTTIIVKNMFYNVPVRRKFLKKEAVEFSHVTDIVTRYALACHQVDIKLFHDGRKVIDAPASKGDLLNTIVSLYGAEHATAMIPVDGQAPTHALHGHVARPEITRSSRGYSSLFVNKRAVHSKEIARAVEDAYHGRLMKGRYPFYVLFLDIDPVLIDVNIHPSKKEVKFSNEDDLVRDVHDWVLAALDARVKKMPVDPIDHGARLDDIILATTSKPAVGHAVSGIAGRDSPAAPAGASRSPARSFDDLLHDASARVPAGILDVDSTFNDALHDAPGSDATQVPVEDKMPRQARLGGWVPLVNQDQGDTMDHVHDATFRVLPPARLLHHGVQLGNAFLFFATGDGDLLVVDQHAASERVEYEKLLAKVKMTSITSQQLLVPKRLALAPALLAMLEVHEGTLKQYGFDFIKETDGDVPVFKVTRYPHLFHKKIDFRVIEDFLEDLLASGHATLDGSTDNILQVMACHAAIRSGDPLEPREAWTLLRELDRCKDPHHCCHGRPTFMTYPVSFFEKAFKRIL